MVRHSKLTATLFALGAFWGMTGGCTESRPVPEGVDGWDDGIGALVTERCGSCHGTGAAEGGYRASFWVESLCLADGQPATGGPSSPFVRALESPTHTRVVTPEERARLVAWSQRGAPQRQAGTHEAAFTDPRSPGSHGRFLRSVRWVPMLEPSDPRACGRCHEGVARPDGITRTAPGATACTSCHSEPKGVFACATCHGAPDRPYPPRAGCFFPEEQGRAGAHAAHTTKGPVRAEALPCAACHPSHSSEAQLVDGAHGNGVIDVVLDPVWAGRSSFRSNDKTCTTSCHGGPGARRPTPSWTDRGPLACHDCHGAPPPDHPTGSCTTCHAEATSDGTALTTTLQHLNGRIDLGDGSGTCGACHGKMDDPWPATGAHALHRAPTTSAPVPCASCHEVPTSFGPGSNHPRGGPARIRFGGLASNRGVRPVADGQSCANMYCHGAGLLGGEPKVFQWQAPATPAACDACHGMPPGSPHTSSAACETCHAPVAIRDARGISIAPGERHRHIDGIVDR